MNSPKGHLSRQNAFVDVCVGPDRGVGLALANDDMIKSGTPFGFLSVRRGGAWTARATELPVELSSLCWFQDKLYAASTRDIFVLDETRQFVPIAIPDDFPRTCGALATNGHILASAGERDLFTFDGAAWRRLD